MVVLDVLLERVLQLFLESGVEVGDEEVPLFGLGFVQRADDLVLGVHRQLVLAVHALQVGLVLLLQPGLAVLAGRLVALVGVVRQLGARDGADVAEHVGRGAPARPALGVGADRRLLHAHAGEFGLMLVEVLDGGGRRTGQHRHRLVHAVLGVLQGPHDLRRGLADQRGDLGDDAGVDDRGVPRQNDLLLDLVADDDRPVAVEDLTARGRDGHLTDLVLVDRRRRPLLPNHLEVPEPQDHRGEQGQEDQPDHGDPDIRA